MGRRIPRNHAVLLSDGRGSRVAWGYAWIAQNHAGERARAQHLTHPSRILSLRYQPVVEGYREHQEIFAHL